MWQTLMINSATFNQITERDNKYQGHQNKRQSRSNEPTSFPSSLGAQRVAHGGTTSAGPAYPYENRDLKQTMRHQSNKFQILEQRRLSHLRRISTFEKVRFQLLSTLCGPAPRAIERSSPPQVGHLPNDCVRPTTFIGPYFPLCPNSSFWNRTQIASHVLDQKFGGGRSITSACRI